MDNDPPLRAATPSTECLASVESSLDDAELERCPPEGLMAGRGGRLTAFLQVPGAASRFVALPHCGASEHAHDNVQISVPFARSELLARWHTASGVACRRVVRVNECCVVPSGQPHRFHFRGSAELVNLYLEPVWLEQAADESVGRGGWYLSEDYRCQDPVLLQLGGALREAYVTLPAPPRMLLEGAAAVAAMRLLRRKASSQRVSVRADKLTPAALRRALEHIEAHLGEDLGLVGIAAAAHCSPFHFARAFKAATGLPPHRFVTWQRIEKAKRYLREEDLAIGRVSVECGFQNPGHFARLFRQATGQSPRRYRQQSKA